jgi:F0F1-type ATP synthase assembly protein I
MSDDRKRLPDYDRPEMPFERRASLGGSVGSLAAVGFEFGAVVALFFLGGTFLDGKLGTDPWLTVAGALLGVALGMYLLIRRVLGTSDSQGRDGGSQPPAA